MQFNFHWYDLVLLYAVEYIPYIIFAVTTTLITRDLILRKLHKSTVIITVTALVIFVLTRFLARVI